MKPKAFNIIYENEIEMIMTNEKPFKFYRKKQYLSIRKKIVKELKNISTFHNLSLRTFFLAVHYVDKISSKMVSFSEIESISKFCLILAAKFSENGVKACKLEKDFKNELSSNYLNDEIFILQLLNYDLHFPTLYDSLLTILHKGILFENERICNKTIVFAYDTAIKTVLHIIETKLILEIPMKYLVFGIIGFARELIGLEPFSQILKEINEIGEDTLPYNDALFKIKEFFKIKKVNSVKIEKENLEENNNNFNQKLQNSKQMLNNNTNSNLISYNLS